MTPNTHSAWVLALATTRGRFVLKNSARTPSCDHADALMQAVGGSPCHVEACFLLPSVLGDSIQPLVTCLVSRDTKRALAATRKKLVWEHFMEKCSTWACLLLRLVSASRELQHVLTRLFFLLRRCYEGATIEHREILLCLVPPSCARSIYDIITI